VNPVSDLEVGMRFEILGPIRIRTGHAELSTTAGRERTLVAMLVLHAGQTVPTHRLVEAIWPGVTPRNARGQLHGCVSRLRRWLAVAGAGGEVILTDLAGYRLDAGPSHQVDLLELRDQLAQARSAARDGQLEQAVKHYRTAQALWRGAALAGIDSPAVRQLAARLDEEHIQAREECLDLELSLGAGGALVPELTDLVHQHPYRENLHRALMLALFRAGRQADALAAYQHVRTQLVAELGQEPGPALQQLHQRILTGDGELLAAGRRVGTEPLTGPRADPVPAGHVLPRTVEDFTGRQDDLAWIMRAAGHADPYAPLILAIDGMPGVGKTSLAVRAAHLLSASYPDGQLFIDLHGHSARSPTEPAAALATLLRQLGTPPRQIPADLDERIERWRSELAGRRILLVLDNAATTTQITPLLPAVAGALVLVTSRRRLLDLDGARRHSMDLLTPDEAVALLSRIAGGRVREEPDAAAEVAKHCGHLPLALRLAAARLAHRPHWRVRDLADRLADPRQPLAGLTAESHSVADAFALSYHQLAPGTRRTFRLLGLHPGEHLDAHVAAALTGTTLTGTRQHLDELVDAHLVEEIHPHRYRLHDLVRTYATQLTHTTDSDQERDTAIRGLLDYYLHAAAAAGEHLEYLVSRSNFQPGAPLRPDLLEEHSSSGTGWLEPERGNLTAAVSLSASYGHDRYTWLIARALWAFLFTAGYIDDLIATHRHGLAAAERLGDPEAVSTTGNYLASAYYRAGAYHLAADHMQQIISVLRQAGNPAREAVARKNLAIVYSCQGKGQETEDLCERALALAYRAGDPHVVTSVIANTGAVFLNLGRYGAALAYSRRALPLARQTGDHSLLDIAFSNAGVARARLGQYGPALRLLTAALGLKRRNGNRYGEAEVLNELGVVHREMGSLDEALAHHRQALEVMRRAGDRMGEYAIYTELARTLHATGDTQTALEFHRRALAGTTKIGHKYGQARALDGIATCLRDTDPTAAGHHWVRALRLYLELDAPERDQVHHNLAALHG
jgi:DNA-binding SARP family transcriptional activator